MTLFTVEELREVVGAKILAGEGTGWTRHCIRRISLDTRSLRPGDLFLALRGDRFDGHDFGDHSLRRRFAVASRDSNDRDLKSASVVRGQLLVGIEWIADTEDKWLGSLRATLQGEP